MDGPWSDRPGEPQSPKPAGGLHTAHLCEVWFRVARGSKGSNHRHTFTWDRRHAPKSQPLSYQRHLFPLKTQQGVTPKSGPRRGEEGPTVESSPKGRLEVLVPRLVAAAGGPGSRMNTCSSAHLQSKWDKTAWVPILLQGPAQERPAHTLGLLWKTRHLPMFLPTQA